MDNIYCVFIGVRRIPPGKFPRKFSWSNSPCKFPSKVPFPPPPVNSPILLPLPPKIFFFVLQETIFITLRKVFAEESFAVFAFLPKSAKVSKNFAILPNHKTQFERYNKKLQKNETSRGGGKNMGNSPGEFNRGICYCLPTNIFLFFKTATTNYQAVFSFLTVEKEKGIKNSMDRYIISKLQLFLMAY